MGRPPKGEESKRHVIALRVGPTMHQKLTAAAEAAGRSIAQEVEYRFERMFFDEDVRSLKPSGRALLEFVAALISGVQAQTGKAFDEDYPTFMALSESLKVALAQFEPGDGGLDREAADKIGAAIAKAGRPSNAAAKQLCEAAGLPTNWSGQRAIAFLLLGEKAEDDDLAAANLGLYDDPDTFDDRQLEKLDQPVKEAAAAFLEAERKGQREIARIVDDPRARSVFARFDAAWHTAQEISANLVPRILPPKSPKA